MVIVEHFPEFVLKTIQVTPETYECFANECVHLVAMNPEDKSLYYFKDGAFSSYWRIFTFKNFSFFLDYQFICYVAQKGPLFFMHRLLQDVVCL
jgi:hypothetical protein